MFPRATPLTPLEIQSLITRDPLTVSPDTLVRDAIARMNQVQSRCIITDSEGSQLNDFHQQARSSCVLVLQQEQVIGILTEWDIIRLSLQQHPLQEQTMAQVMSHPVITLNELALTDIFAILQRFQNHQIRHLPILNEQDHLIGLITYESLRQVALTCHLARTYPQQTDEKENEIAQLSVQEAIALQQTKTRLRQSEQRYASLAAAAPVGIFNANVHGDCIYVNERCCTILGYSLEDYMGKKWQQGLHPEDQPQVIAQWQQAIRENRLFQIECRFIRPDGTVVWVYSQATTERDLEGKIIGYIGTIIDISDRKKAELERQQAITQLQQLNQKLETQVTKRTAKLRKREAELQDFFDNAHDLIQSVSLETGRFEYVNRAWREALGYTPEEIETLHLFDILHPNSQPHCQNIITQMQAGTLSTIEKLEITLISKTGQAIIVEGGINCRFANNKPVATWTILRDITAGKRIEAENHRLRERLAFLLDSSPAIIYSCRPSGNYQGTYVSQNAQTLFGYTPEEILADPNFWLNRLHPDDAPQLLAQLAKITDEKTYRYEYRFLHRNGHYIWVRDELRLVRDKQGNPVEFVGYFTDISEQKENQLALQDSEAFRRAIMDLAPMGIFVYDINLGKVIFGNQAYEESLGYSLAEIQALGEDVLPTLYHPDYLEYLQAHDQQIKADREGKIFELDYTMIRKDGSLLLAYSREVVLNRNPDGSPAQILGVGLDITKRKQTELQLQKNNEELLRATRLKDEFLANMSHELRTPLNAILGMTESLQEQIFGSLNERQLNALNTIERSGTHLLELINEILDLAKIESGEMTIDCHPTSVSSVCQTSLTFVKRQAHKKRLKLEVNVPPYLPELLVDAKRIRQVLINLLNNAVKFTPEGGTINLDARYVPALGKPLGTEITLETPLQDYLEIVIRDTGIGIAPEHLPKLFQPFVQIDSSLNRKYEGTGLGLSLVKRIIDLHGGEVNVSSEVGVGSCFTIRLPSPPLAPASRSFSSSSAVEISGSSPQEDKPPLILIADDNEANRSTFVSYLEAKGYRLIVASNGKEAITQAESSFPDAILMDIQMPEMDGLEGIRIIRQNPQLAQIPIMALTGLAMPEDQERCLAAGANDYLTKPVKLNELACRVQGLLLISRED